MDKDVLCNKGFTFPVHLEQNLSSPAIHGKTKAKVVHEFSVVSVVTVGQKDKERKKQPRYLRTYSFMKILALQYTIFNHSLY